MRRQRQRFLVAGDNVRPGAECRIGDHPRHPPARTGDGVGQNRRGRADVERVGKRALHGGQPRGEFVCDRAQQEVGGALRQRTLEPAADEGTVEYARRFGHAALMALAGRRVKALLRGRDSYGVLNATP